MAVFHVTFQSMALGRTVPLCVILPTDKMYFGPAPKKREDKPFKTLYLLHGIVGSHTDWLYGTSIQRYAEEHDLAVVMPAGENSFYLDQPWNVAMYGDYIGRELVEFTRKSFPLSRKREDTYIGGLSMGGFGALRNGLKYHDTFGAIVSLSGAFITDETLLIKEEKPMFPSQTEEFKHGCFGPDLEAALKSDINPTVLIEILAKEKVEFPAIYLACGAQDFLLEKNDAIAKTLEENGVPFLYEVDPGAHEWEFWDTHIKRALEWLPLEDKAAGINSGNIGFDKADE